MNTVSTSLHRDGDIAVGAAARLARLTWLALTAAGFAVTCYLASHRSEAPSVLNRYSTGYFALLVAAAAASLVLALSNRDAVWVHIREGVGLLLVASVSTVIGVAALETAVRIADPLGISYLSAITEYSRHNLPDDELIYKQPPRAVGIYGGVAYRFNELGFRDEPVTAKVDREYRILLLGDSVALGWGVRQDQIFAPQLQAALAKTLDRPVRIVNSAVASYNTVQELAAYRRFARPLQADLALLIYVGNDTIIHPRPFDPDKEQSLQGKSPPQVLKSLLTRSWLIRLATVPFRRDDSALTTPAAIEAASNSAGWRASMEAMRQLVAATRSDRVPLAMAYFRWSADPYSDALIADVRRAADGCPLWDIGEWWTGRSIRTLVNSHTDSHPNSAGHRILADRLAAQLMPIASRQLVAR